MIFDLGPEQDLYAFFQRFPGYLEKSPVDADKVIGPDRSANFRLYGTLFFFNQGWITMPASRVMVEFGYFSLYPELML